MWTLRAQPAQPELPTKLLATAFCWLTLRDRLLVAALVCKSWHRASISPPFCDEATVGILTRAERGKPLVVMRNGLHAQPHSKRARFRDEPAYAAEQYREDLTGVWHVEAVFLPLARAEAVLRRPDLAAVRRLCLQLDGGEVEPGEAARRPWWAPLAACPAWPALEALCLRTEEPPEGLAWARGLTALEELEMDATFTLAPAAAAIPPLPRVRRIACDVHFEEAADVAALRAACPSLELLLRARVASQAALDGFAEWAASGGLRCNFLEVSPTGHTRLDFYDHPEAAAGVAAACSGEGDEACAALLLESCALPESWPPGAFDGLDCLRVRRCVLGPEHVAWFFGGPHIQSARFLEVELLVDHDTPLEEVAEHVHRMPEGGPAEFLKIALAEDAAEAELGPFLDGLAGSRTPGRPPYIKVEVGGRRGLAAALEAAGARAPYERLRRSNPPRPDLPELYGL